MMMNQAVKNAFKKKRDRKWDKMYWMIDVHDTILAGEYSSTQSYNPSKEAVEVLKWLWDRDDMVVLIWTSSYHKDFERMAKWFWKTHGIGFDYFNENPECGNTDYAEFETKPYFNILLDDKAGFDIKKDWRKIRDALVEEGVWFNNTFNLYQDNDPDTPVKCNHCSGIEFKKVNLYLRESRCVNCGWNIIENHLKHIDIN